MPWSHPLDAVQNLYGVQRRSTLLGMTSMETVTPVPEPAARRRPGPRRALTENEILDAALGLLDDGGPDAASVRGIAARVGVAPNAVYTYFPDKAAVVQALVERLLGEADHDVFADRERPWRERVEALALDLRARLSAHPGAVTLMVGGPMNGPNALALNGRLLELLADAGLCPTDAARASYLLIIYVFGSIALEVADASPRSADAAATMAGCISTEQYLWGLRRVLDGIAAHAADPGPPEPVRPATDSAAGARIGSGD
jgi:AcrR family transcriptional regulator